MLSASTVAVLDRVHRAWAPPPELTVSQFADREIVVATGPYAGSRWNTDFAPYQRGIMDALHEPGVEYIAIMGSSQWGKTAIGVNVCSYFIAHDPCPILVVMPTVDPMAKDFAKRRLDPTIKASPALSEVVDQKRQKDASNTTLLKTFRGGALALAGANSAASLASRDIRVLWCDEIDRWPLELPGEGSTLSIVMKRTTTFRTRKRIFLVSSPTLKNGPIHSWFQRGDQRRYFVPCPSCETFHAYEWKHVVWEKRDPATARMACPSCGFQIDNDMRVALLARGEWRSTAPEHELGVVSFHMWEAYSPLSSLQDIVAGFLRARDAQKAGDESEMHTWQNTTLGEPVEPSQGDGVDSHVLLVRREEFEAELPAGVCCLTMGVDTQDDRLEALVVGWGPGEESWLVDRHALPGDPQLAEPWTMLDELLGREYMHASGVALPISATAIDSAGHRTTFVYDYGLKRAARRVFVVIGRDGARPIVSSPSPRRWGREQRQVPLYTIGVDAAKSLIVSRLKLTKESGDGRADVSQPGYVHMPMADWCDDELAAQLTSERLVTKMHHGYPRSTWVKTRPRNEALDNFVYALAALRLLRPDLAALAARLKVQTKPAAPADAPKATSGWIRPRGESWLRRR